MKAFIVKIINYLYYIKGILLKKVHRVKISFYHIISGIRIMNSSKTIDYIIKHKCCVSRFGDGELGMVLTVHNIGFQKYDNLLSEKLSEILKCKSQDILICLPYYFFCEKDLKGFAYNFWHEWNKKHLIETLKYLMQNSRKKFGDTQISRPYIDRLDKKSAGEIFVGLKKIWENLDILIVEGEQTHLGVGNDLFDNTKSIKRILAPSKNAFSVYDKLLSSIEEHYNGELILMALGPTATCLAYDCFKKGYWAIDIGHIDIEYEWFIRGSLKKEAIEGKYVNEVNNGDICTTCNDKSYLDSICCIIKE